MPLACRTVGRSRGINQRSIKQSKNSKRCCGRERTQNQRLLLGQLRRPSRLWRFSKTARARDRTL